MSYDDEDNVSKYRKPAIIAAIAVPILFIVVYLVFSGRHQPVAFNPSTVPAEGTVLLKGKPVAGIRVTYHPQFDVGRVKFTPNGTTNPEGKFVLGSARPNDGAPPGEYIVTFDYPYTKTDGPIEEETDWFKGKYSDPAKSPWKVKVEANSQESFQLD